MTTHASEAEEPISSRAGTSMHTRRWNRKGIDTILASLLLVVIVVVMSVIVYSWSMGVFGSILPKYRHSSHNRRQLLRYRLEWQPVRQDDRLDEGTLLADTACDTPSHNPVAAVNILHMDRRSLHVPVRERLHSHTCHVPQQPVLIHNPTLDKKSSKPTPIFKTLADIQISGPEAIL
ncbi:hypothetical protein E6H22_00225 [Candidatus Bathyarchaeota archaeon]|nr:MAG: hypothetical protein E6H22_00225 [Candidatus Bathyarchaeota archaeon]